LFYIYLDLFLFSSSHFHKLAHTPNLGPHSKPWPTIQTLVHTFPNVGPHISIRWPTHFHTLAHTFPYVSPHISIHWPTHFHTLAHTFYLGLCFHTSLSLFLPFYSLRSIIRHCGSDLTLLLCYKTYSFLPCCLMQSIRKLVIWLNGPNCMKPKFYVADNKENKKKIEIICC
jgi:hypothetical protein